MRQAGGNANAEIRRIEDSLLCLKEGFTQYKSQVTQAHECAWTLLVRRELGFSDQETAALYEATLDQAIQDYFQLRDQIDWWLEQARRIVAALMKIEQHGIMN